VEARAVGHHVEALVVVERQQDQREHEHAEDLEHTPVLLMIATSRTP
jgi:hypothetical protein